MDARRGKSVISIVLSPCRPAGAEGVEFPDRSSTRRGLAANVAVFLQSLVDPFQFGWYLGIQPNWS
jgi:hypothetical protein